MTALLFGYARCSTDAQDLTAQREGLIRLGVTAERIYVDHGLTGTNREHPGCGRRTRRVVPVTPWWSPSWTGSPDRSATRGRSPTS